MEGVRGVDGLRSRIPDLYAPAAVSAVHLAAVAVYFAVSPDSPLTVRHTVYPVVWTGVGTWALTRAVGRDNGDGGSVALGAAVGTVYLSVLLYLGGTVGLVGGHTRSAATGLDIVGAAPGWGPILVYTGSFVHVRAIPFVVFGYLTLSYLVSVSVVRSPSSLVGAATGALSCVGCTWPVVAGLLSAVGGLGVASVSAGAVTGYAYGLSTVVFMVSVLLVIRLGGLSTS